MNILFSPIGTADPLTTLGDGPMLHIARNYRPDKIILFLSKSMASYEESDHRYTKAIELLYGRLDAKAPETSILESAIDEVHRYDAFIAEFEAALSSLQKSHPDATILANVTSGTPAMQQALVAIHAFGRKGIKAVQVETPRKDINQSGDREDPSNYDFDTLWDINPDNESNRENRCREIESANFSDLILRDNIRTLVKEYDYAAASILAEQCKSIPDEASNLINGCKYRIMLDSSRAIPFFKGTSHTYNPANTLSEYVSMLETHIERKQWGDYLRATTPAITEILFRKVRTYLNDDKWTKQVPKRDRIVLVVDSDKVANIPELKFTLAKVREESEVNDHVLTLVLRQYLDKSEFDPYDKLRDMESKVRNPVAHEIRPINKESIERIAGLSLEESLRIMLRLSGTKPGLYKRINQDILDLIK